MVSYEVECCVCQNLFKVSASELDTDQELLQGLLVEVNKAWCPYCNRDSDVVFLKRYVE